MFWLLGLELNDVGTSDSRAVELVEMNRDPEVDCDDIVVVKRLLVKELG